MALIIFSIISTYQASKQHPRLELKLPSHSEVWQVNARDYREMQCKLEQPVLLHRDAYRLFSIWFIGTMTSFEFIVDIERLHSRELIQSMYALFRAHKSYSVF